MTCDSAARKRKCHIDWMKEKPGANRLDFDANGNARWEEKIATGEYAPVESDPATLEKLKAGQLSLVETRRMRALNMPYGNGRQPDKLLKTRNGLDYLRALSESIKAKRKLESEGGGGKR